MRHMGMSFHQECPNFKKVANGCHGEPMMLPSCFTDGESEEIQRERYFAQGHTAIVPIGCIFTESLSVG